MFPFVKLTTFTERKPDTSLKILSNTSSKSFANFANSSEEGSVNPSVNSMFMIVSFALHILLGVGLVGFSVPLVRITIVVDSKYIDVVDDNEEDDTNKKEDDEEEDKEGEGGEDTDDDDNKGPKEEEEDGGEELGKDDDANELKEAKDDDDEEAKVKVELKDRDGDKDKDIDIPSCPLLGSVEPVE